MDQLWLISIDWELPIDWEGMKYNESKDKVQGHGMMMLCGDMMVIKKSPLVGNKFMACGISDQNKMA